MHQPWLSNAKYRLDASNAFLMNWSEEFLCIDFFLLPVCEQLVMKHFKGEFKQNKAKKMNFIKSIHLIFYVRALWPL